jgi:hypothetical protein
LKRNVKNTPPTPRRGVRLRNIYDVMRLLAKTTNGLLKGEIAEAKAAKIGYLCSVMISGYEKMQMADIERRLAELELSANEEYTDTRRNGDEKISVN